ncbi:MAG: molybdopterin-guanine dinucleotide biosynthesis protein B [Natronincolaceae bacterium]|jgi:molybdopterin-guanine dinucleotide biosynthesis protein B|nr:molybdopterin-guanine dinucleotide biosynthesis protein B [Bacillota bacterium]NLK91049.1 molybdopterin-guanine dinucleotide biosynthesis protein B [Clostridiales bacterium]
MKVLSVIGTSKTGKTTIIENIIRELRRRRYTVGSVKDIHFEKFAMDTEGTNTDRHKKAGSQLVTARGMYETDVLFQERISMDKLLRFYDHDFVILEGVTDINAPRIVAAIDKEGIEAKYDELTFCISGVISNTETEYKGLPVINSIDNIERLVDLIEEKVYDRLPDFPTECCDACGFNCRELGSKILKGEAKRENCRILNTEVELLVDGNKIQIVPFVEDILANAVLGVVKELEGYKKGKEIKVTINR